MRWSSPERIEVPRLSVEDIALANAQLVDPQAKIVFRQQRRINGVDVRFLKIEAEVNRVLRPTGLFLRRRIRYGSGGDVHREDSIGEVQDGVYELPRRVCGLEIAVPSRPHRFRGTCQC